MSCQQSAEFQMMLNVLCMDQSFFKFFYDGDISHLKT